MTELHSKQELAWDRVSRVYHGEESDPETQRLTRRRIDWIVSQTTGREVLDIGCSDGLVATHLTRRGHSVRGVDIQAGAIEAAKELADRLLADLAGRPLFEVMDSLDLTDRPETYDTVIMGEVIQCCVDPERMVTLAAASIRAGGRLIITVPWGLSPTLGAQRPLFLSDILALLPGGFSVEHISITDGHVRLVATRPATNANETVARPSDAVLLHMSEEAALESQRRFQAIIDRKTDGLQQSFAMINEITHANGDALLSERHAGQDPQIGADWGINPREMEELAQSALDNERLRRRAIHELGQVSDALQAARVELLTALGEAESARHSQAAADEARYRAEGALAELRLLTTEPTKPHPRTLAKVSLRLRGGASRQSASPRISASQTLLRIYQVPTIHSLVLATMSPERRRRLGARLRKQARGQGSPGDGR